MKILLRLVLWGGGIALFIMLLGWAGGIRQE
nr:Uncharacterised protein [Salmonella sp. NCTC 7297]